MSLFGLSPAAFFFGALALIAGIALLHLLRVRLRRVEVDTLLFFELAGTIRQPRVLLSKPARWLAFLLALAAALLAFTALADPRAGAERASRLVVLEPAAGELWDLRISEAERWVRAGGLGPRGAVLAATGAPATLLAADEPIDWLHARASARTFASDAHAHERALRLAAERLRARDEIVWIGSTPPAVALPIALRIALVEGAPALRWDALRWEWLPLGAAEAPRCELVLEGVAAAPLELELRDASAGTVASAAAAAGVFAVRLAVDAPRPGETFALRCRSGADMIATWSLPSPASEVRTVGLDAALEPDLAKALRAAIALDPRFETSLTLADADLIAAPQDDPSDPRPRLVLSAGEGLGPRAAETSSESPVRLVLRDRERRSAPALAGRAGTTWVEDLRQGAQLARAQLEGVRPRVEIVAWLLQPITHADVPALLSSSLELLAGASAVRLAPASRELELVSGDAAAFRGAQSIALPAEGRVRFAAARDAGDEIATPRGAIRLAALEDPSPALGPAREMVEEIEALGGSRSWIAVLLLAALALFALDAWAFHRGRMP